MAVGYNPRTVTDGLVLALDAGNTKSYDPYVITYVGGTSNSDNSSSFTLNGLQAGDLVLYFSAEDTSNVVTPAGASWTAIPGLGTQPDNDGRPSSAAFYVFATGTSVTASGLPTAGLSKYFVHVMIAFRNVSSTNPFDVNATENNPISGVPNPPSITPVTDNSMIVAVGLHDNADIASSVSPPTGYTTAVNDGSSNSATIMTAYKLLETAAAEDPGAFNYSADEVNKGISIALRLATNPIWTDLIGSNNGTLTNGPTYSSDDGGSIVFDGSNDYVQLSASSDLNFGTGNFTIEGWFNKGATTANLALLGSDRVYSPSHNGTWILRISSATQIAFATYDGKGNIESAEFSASTLVDTWHHFALVREGTGTNETKFYLDGVLKGSMTVSKSLTDAGTNGLRIGEEGDPGRGNDPFNGKISNVKLYKSKGLTATEVEQNYNALKGRYA